MSVYTDFTVSFSVSVPFVLTETEKFSDAESFEATYSPLIPSATVIIFLPLSAAISFVADVKAEFSEYAPSYIMMLSAAVTPFAISVWE